MKRTNISGFEFHFFGYTVEVVTVKFIPCCLAIRKHTRLIKRFEIGGN
jgi:hypothetical protein